LIRGIDFDQHPFVQNAGLQPGKCSDGVDHSPLLADNPADVFRMHRKEIDLQAIFFLLRNFQRFRMADNEGQKF